VNGPEPRVFPCAVVEPHHVDLEIQARRQLLAVALARVVALDRVGNLLHCLAAPRALAHDIHVHLQDLLSL